jgi:hypothetical protein
MFKLLKNIFYIIPLFTIAILFSHCSTKEKKDAGQEKQVHELPVLPEFNADSAYAFVKAQCDFGPRVPNTKAHERCSEYLISRMKSWSDTVYIQSDIVTAFDGTNLRFKNIIASFNPQAKRRVLLFAHWDTRPWADQDETDKDKPNLGADDGASGVGVLLELARLFKQNKPSIGIDLALFDAEDWGKEGGGPEAQDSYALGTQYWTKYPHVQNYAAEYGILLDMVGAANARFRREGYSRQEASFVIDKVWLAAQQSGYSSYFLFEDCGWITDDHVYVNRFNIPSIDIINSSPGSKSGFAPHWHTHKDNLDIIDKNTLKAVGQTLVAVLMGGEG